MSSVTMSTTRPDRLTACSWASAGLADLDQGPALRPRQAEQGVRLGHRRQPGRRSQVLGGDALVVGAQVAQDAVLAAPVAYRPRVERRVVLPGLCRLGEQGFPGLVRRNRPASRPLLCVLCLPPGRPPGDPPGGAPAPYPPGGTCRNTRARPGRPARSGRPPAPGRCRAGSCAPAPRASYRKVSAVCRVPGGSRRARAGATAAPGAPRGAGSSGRRRARRPRRAPRTGSAAPRRRAGRCPRPGCRRPRRSASTAR